MSKSYRFGRGGLITMLMLTISACSVPASMHVTKGTDPRHVNDQVRFRATYYFRTFDYCWDADVKVRQLAVEGAPQIDYRKIIPQTDTLFRYRMTGKAPSLTNKVRFESGTMRKEEIEPFGKQLVYSDAGNGFYVRDISQVRDAAVREDNEKLQWLHIERLRALYDSLHKVDDAELRTTLRTEIVNAIRSLIGQPTALTVQQKAEIERLIEERSKAFAAANADANVKVAEFKQQIAELRDKVDQIPIKTDNALGLCPIGEKIRKGFQIMGPEGIKTFDQDERLVLAMSSSAKPLIAALQEYGSRILDSRASGTAQRLAVSDELVRALRARQAVADAKLGGEAEPANLIDAAIKALNGGPLVTTPGPSTAAAPATGGQQ